MSRQREERVGEGGHSRLHCEGWSQLGCMETRRKEAFVVGSIRDACLLAGSEGRCAPRSCQSGMFSTMAKASPGDIDSWVTVLMVWHITVFPELV